MAKKSGPRVSTSPPQPIISGMDGQQMLNEILLGLPRKECDVPFADLKSGRRSARTPDKSAWEVALVASLGVPPERSATTRSCLERPGQPRIERCPNP
jgi:hypothetical protein